MAQAIASLKAPLRKHGVRLTRQRELLFEIIHNSHTHLNADRLYELARQRDLKISRVTVYRTLKALLEEGWLSAVEMPGQPQRYEQAGKEHHHHFNCNRCGRTFEMDGCPGGLDQMVPVGFKMETHEVFIYGLCEECQP